MIGDIKKAEIVRFIMTGTIAALIQYGLYIVLLSECGLSAVISTIVSYCVSLTVNYFMSNLFTFKTRPGRKNAVAFFACHMLNIALQTSLVAIFSRCINPEYALVPAMAICVPCNFLLVRFALKSNCFNN